MAVEPDAVETREEHAQDTDFARSGLVEHRVVSKTAKIGCGCGRHGCLIDDGMRNQAK